jgi:hypothetical protein
VSEGLSNASGLADTRARLGVKLARGSGLEALCPSDEGLSLGTQALRNSHSEPLYCCRHRRGAKCSRRAQKPQPAQ